MVSQKQGVNLRPLTHWLVGAAKAGYGAMEPGGLGWRLPCDFGTCVAGALNQDVFSIYCADQESAWLKTATGFVAHGQNLCFLFGEILFLLPVPAEFQPMKIRQVVIHENRFPFTVLRKIKPVLIDQLDAALNGPLFFFHSRGN